jgi:hypothetical protein
MNSNICEIMGIEYILTNTEDGILELTPIVKMNGVLVSLYGAIYAKDLLEYLQNLSISADTRCTAEFMNVLRYLNKTSGTEYSNKFITFLEHLYILSGATFSKDFLEILQKIHLSSKTVYAIDFLYFLETMNLETEKKMKPVKPMTPVTPSAPVVEPTISLELQELFDNIPHSIPTLITKYNSFSKFDAAMLIKKLHDSRNINELLEFYVYDIYPGSYFYGIKFALSVLAKHKDGIEIFNKIKNGIDLSYEEENIIDYGGHSGSSFEGLKYWLQNIFQKIQGDAFNNYHLVFDEGEFQRRYYLFLD